MKKLFFCTSSLVLALCFLFLTGCKIKSNDSQTTSDTSSETTSEQASFTSNMHSLVNDTTASQLDTSAAEQTSIAPTKPSKAPIPVVTVPQTIPAPTVKKIDSYKWNPEGVYKVGYEKNMLIPGEYYVVKTGTKDASINMVNYKSARPIDSVSYLVNLNLGDEVYLIGCKIIHSSVEHPHAQPDGKYLSGIYKIGRDIPAGEYILRQTGEYARFGLVPDANIRGNYDDLRGRVKNFSYVTLKEGSYLRLDRCTLEAVTDKPIVNPSGEVYPQGMYLVGKDLPEGEYLARPLANSSYIYFYNSSAYPSSPSKTITLRKNKETLVVLKQGQYVFADNATLTKRA